MIKFNKATEAIPFIGQPCFIFDSIKDNPIFDSLENNPPVEAYIEGVDIVADKIIAERANFDPHQIAIALDKDSLNLIGLAFYDLKSDIEKYLGEGYEKKALKENIYAINEKMKNHLEVAIGKQIDSGKFNEWIKSIKK